MDSLAQSNAILEGIEQIGLGQLLAEDRLDPGLCLAGGLGRVLFGAQLAQVLVQRCNGSHGVSLLEARVPVAPEDVGERIKTIHRCPKGSCEVFGIRTGIQLGDGTLELSGHFGGRNGDQVPGSCQAQR